ncbi:NAD(P)-dependent oxidoreductase [Marimonas sp. MJW-29]|uniref:NAD(P)-dependent oxidoreductase n=1 Tax=Sulfitobacter sediminis TaxID=3234186 RepID=A0ABV3RH66_9RHOB
MTKRIVVFGATSGIGKLAMEEGLKRGHTVRAFARSADKLDARDGLEICAGDALKAEDVAQALQGIDAVVYCLGIEESVAMLWKEVTLFSRSTEVLLQEMPKADVKRLIVVTGFGAGRSKQAMSFVERTGHRAILGKPYADKDRQEEMLMQSDLDWTIARPVILTNNRGTGKYRVLRDTSSWRNGLISRADVAHYLIDAVEQDADIRADVVLAR